MTGTQVRDGSLTGRDVRNATLTSRDVRDRSLLGRDFRSGELPAGPTGPKGAPGPQGPKGDKGDPGTANLRVVQIKVTLAPGEVAFPNAECAPGEKPTGGGIEPSDENVRILLDTVETVGGTPIGWAAGFANRSGQPQEVFVQAICAS